MSSPDLALDVHLITLMKRSLLLCSIALLSCATARADVTWEHTLSVRMGQSHQPLAQGHFKNSITAQNYRYDMRIDLKGFAPASFGAMTAAAPGSSAPACKPTAPDKLDITSIHRLGDDTVLTFSSMEKVCYTDTLGDLMRKMRLDPWKKLAPRLSTEPAPSLTQAQRDRLGAEVRSATRPFLKKVMCTYFRPLPNKRTFDGLEGRGYRMTWLLNAGGMHHEQWMRVAFEWWLANPQPGDEAIDQYKKATLEKRAALNLSWPTTSFWLNEMLPVWWACAPQELHQALATVRPPDGSFTGTPLRFHMTVEPPALYGMMMGGAVRIDLELTKRSNDTIPATMFEAPADYPKKPFKSPWEELEKLFKGHLPPNVFTASRDLGMTWEAWDETMKAAGASALCMPRS